MSSETNEDSDLSDVKNYPDNREMLQQLKVIEEKVRKLRIRKFELEKQLQQPMKFGDVMYTEHEAVSAAEVEENFNQVERKHYMKKLFFHKLVGVKTVLQEKKDIVFEFNASVKGLYMEPYYLRMRKLQSGKYEIVNYFLPESVLVREMVGDSSYVNDKQIFQLINTIQHYVLAYHRRKEQIFQVKELLKDVKFFYSTDYRFVEFTFTSDIKIPALNVTLSLIYDCDKDVPSTLELLCKEADKKTLAHIRKDVDAFLKLPLNEAVAILTIKESSSDQSFESRNTIILQTSQERVDSLEEEDDDDEIWRNDFNKNTKERHKIQTEPPKGAAKDKKINIGDSIMISSPQIHLKLSPRSTNQSHQTNGSSQLLSLSAPNKLPGSPTRKLRRETKKCRKVYGMEHRELWCTQCKQKKACTKFED